MPLKKEFWLRLSKRVLLQLAVCAVLFGGLFAADFFYPETGKNAKAFLSQNTDFPAAYKTAETAAIGFWNALVSMAEEHI